MSPLHRSLLATIAALDAFEYPPTEREVWRWLWAVDPRTASATGGDSFGLTLPVSEEAVSKGLGDLERAGRLRSERGRWTLPERSGQVRQHFERAATSAKKWSRVQIVGGFLRLVPFVSFYGVCNNLALDNAKKESDADVFIVLRDGHLWTGRALITAIVRSLGFWRHGNRISDRICLSFYVSESAMDLSPLAKPIDPYLALWLAQVVPVLDRNGTFERFRRANAWVEHAMPNAFAEIRTDHRVGVGGPTALAQGAYESFLALTGLGSALEGVTRGFQMKRMEKNWWSRAKDGGTDVVISDLVLKFHESDRRELYRQAIAERVETVLR